MGRAGQKDLGKGLVRADAHRKLFATRLLVHVGFGRVGLTKSVSTDAIDASRVSAMELVEWCLRWVYHILLALKKLDLLGGIVDALHADDYDRVVMIGLLVLVYNFARFHVAWVTRLQGLANKAAMITMELGLVLCLCLSTFDRFVKLPLAFLLFGFTLLRACSTIRHRF